MSVSDQEKLGVKYIAKPSRDAISSVPIKKRRFVFPRSPSPPPQPQSLHAGHSGISTTENKSFFLEPFSSLGAAGSSLYPVALSGNGPPCEVGINVTDHGDKSFSSKYECNGRPDLNRWEQNMDSVVLEGKNGNEDIVYDGKLLSLKRTQLCSLPICPVVDPRSEGTGPDNVFPNDTYASHKLCGRIELQTAYNESNQNIENDDICFTKQGKLVMQDKSSRKEKQFDLQLSKRRCATNSKTDSTCLSVDRSNWDLNTTMDSWEGLSTELAAGHESDGIGKEPYSCPMKEICKKPNSYYGASSDPGTLDSVLQLSLSTSSKSREELHTSDAEIPLDLRLKPSFMSESYFTYGTPFTLRKVDSHREVQFLSLSMKPTSFNSDLKLTECGAVEHDPSDGHIHLNDVKAGSSGSEEFDLKSVKTEPPEIEDSSRIKIPEVADSVGDAVVKLEPLEDRVRGDIAVMGKNSFHIAAENLFQSTNRPLETTLTHTKVFDSLRDSSLKDDILQKKSKSVPLLQSEMISKPEFMQDAVVYSNPVGLVLEPSVDDAKMLNSIVGAPGSTFNHADSLIKCQDDGANKEMNLVKDACKQPNMGMDLMSELLARGAIEEKVDDAKAEDASHITVIASATEPVKKPYANCNVLERNQSNNGNSSSILEDNDDSDCKPASSHGADHIKGVNDNIDYEDGGLRDITALAANEVTCLRESKDSEDACPIGLVDLSVAMPLSHEEKDSQIGSSEMFKDPGTVECVNSHDPGISTVADQLESSSMTGDSSGRKMSKTVRLISRNSLKKDKVTERMSKSDREPLLGAGNDNSQGDSDVANRVIGAHAYASIPSVTEANKDTVIRGHTGRIIYLNSVSRKTKPVTEKGLSSKFRSEKSVDKPFMREKPYSCCSRDEKSCERPHKIERESNKSGACGKRGLNSIHGRGRGGSDPLQRGRDEKRPNQLHVNRKFEPNYIREQIDDHNEFIYSGSIGSVEVTMPSASNASRRMPRKASEELQGHAHTQARRRFSGNHEQISVMRHPAIDVSPDRCMVRDAPKISYVSQEKMMWKMPDEMVDPSLRTSAYSQLDRTDRRPIHRERRSPSPMLRRVPLQLPPINASMSQAISPPHWSSYRSPDGFKGESEMVQIRSAAPIMLHESMRSSHRCFAEEMSVRRHGSSYANRLTDVMIDDISSSQRKFSRSGRHFSRKMSRLDVNDTRQVSEEYYRSPFVHSQSYEHDINGECMVGGRYNDVHMPVRYWKHNIMDEDGEDIPFHAKEGPTRPCRYHDDDNQGFIDGGGSSGEFKGRFRNRLGNACNGYRHVDEQPQQHHEDGFGPHGEKGWNTYSFSNVRQKRRRF